MIETRAAEAEIGTLLTGHEDIAAKGVIRIRKGPDNETEASVEVEVVAIVVKNDSNHENQGWCVERYHSLFFRVRVIHLPTNVVVSQPLLA
jgi:hypothetical protein